MKTNFVLCGFLALLLASVAFAVDYEEDVMVLTSSNFDEVVDNAKIILVEFYAPWCGHCKKLAPEYAKAASELKQSNIPLAKVDATVEKDLGSRFDVTGYPTLKVFKSGLPTAYNGPRDATGIVKYMKKQAEPATKSFENWAGVNKFIEDNNDFTVVGFFEYKDDIKYKKLFSLAADAHRDEYKFVEVFNPEKSMKADFDKFGLDANKEAQIAIENLQTTDRYRYPGEFSVENLREFVNDFLAGKIKPHIKSEPIPTQEGPVTVVVGETFKEIVLDTTKDVLIELYAPWCGHCKKLEPIYKELAEALKDQPNLVIAKMDATANDASHPEYQAKGYPTILFAPANNKDHPIKFTGSRDVAGFTEFLKKHVSLPWTSEKTEL